MMQTIPEGVDPTSIARKKRKEIISNLRHQNTNKRLKDDDPTVVSSVQDTDRDADTVSDNKPRTKYQNHYEPDVPMTKEQAAEWRKEARRKRNRESAAASRNKVRNRIAELEQEVQDWKDKYSTLLKRIETLEQQQLQQQRRNRLNADCRDSSRVPTRLPLNHQMCVSPCLTPTLSPSSSETDEQSHHRHHQIVDLHDSMVDQLKVPLDLEEEHFENSQPKIVAKDCNHLKTENQMSCKRGDPLVVVSSSSSSSVPNEFHLNNLEKTSRPAE